MRVSTIQDLWEFYSRPERGRTFTVATDIDFLAAKEVLEWCKKHSSHTANGIAAAVSAVARAELEDRAQVWTMGLRDFAKRLKRCAAETKPMIDSHQHVYEVIRDLGPIQGPDICRQAGVELPNLKGKILPALRERFPSLAHKRGAGYFFP